MKSKTWQQLGAMTALVACTVAQPAAAHWVVSPNLADWNNELEWWTVEHEPNFRAEVNAYSSGSKITPLNGEDTFAFVVSACASEDTGSYYMVSIDLLQNERTLRADCVNFELCMFGYGGIAEPGEDDPIPSR